MINYQPLINCWRGSQLDRWAQQLEQQVSTGLSQERYGDLARWLQALEDLPSLTVDSIHLNTSRVGASSALPLDEQRRHSCARRCSDCIHGAKVRSSFLVYT